MSRLSDAIIALQSAMDEENIDNREDLPLKLFEFSTTLRPFINVDLLILNENNQILLSWRSDACYGSGWQIPGGIIRMMESIDERIQKTAVREIGCEVEYELEPILVYENIIRAQRPGLNNQLVRAHNIVLMYKCRIPSGFTINNHGLCKTDEGYLCWFDKFPQDMLGCHKQLRRYKSLREWT